MNPQVMGTTDPLEFLSEAWRVLRLSVKCSSRVPTWDAIVLTAASPAQAELFQRHLEQAQLNGTIAAQTVMLAVPDPEGHRIGSGAATLSALRALAQHLQDSAESPRKKEVQKSMYDNFDLEIRVLLLHTGGDSKRVPWANPIGKAFLPLPFLAGEDPDEPILTLFDHILAVSANALQAFRNKGGLLIMTGDVLPCFDASSLSLPENGALVVTVPTSLLIASKHGVILSSQVLEDAENKPLLVEDLLQKPCAEEMVKRGAVNLDGKALLDTGIFIVVGEAWHGLVAFALSDPDPVMDVIATGDEVSLYEDIAGAWVPTRNNWLASRPLGKKLIDALGSSRLYHHCARELVFLHFGTSSEVLDHLCEDHMGRIARNQHSSVPSATVCEVAPSAVLIGCDIHPGVSVGENSLVCDCTLVNGVQIGARCVAMGLQSKSQEEVSLFVLPDRHCLWEVPVTVQSVNFRVMLCCGLDDDPKISIQSGGTFCGEAWAKFLSRRRISETDLWTANSQQDLWHAKLFPAVSQGGGICFVMWLLGASRKDVDQSSVLHKWRASQRLSLDDLHGHINFKQMYLEVSEHRAKLAAGLLKASMQCGLMGRNFSKLCQSIVQGSSDRGMKVVRELLAHCPEPNSKKVILLPTSRIYQAQVDLLKACGDDSAVSALESKVWDAVSQETSAAVGQSDMGTMVKYSRGIPSTHNNDIIHYSISIPTTVNYAKVELPVRLDIVGGWSDTPPWSLERLGCVLNMAVQLDRSSPIGAQIGPQVSGTGISISDDVGNRVTIKDPKAISPPFEANDPFRLVKAALIVTGFGGPEAQRGSQALQIRTWSNVPRGSGLGVSSILAAAVVKGLLGVRGGDDSSDNAARLVLVLEQLMGTGGGWQDQIGGVYPGIKCTTSMPGRPLRLKVERVFVSTSLRDELEARLVVVFTGQVRLAHTVLQKVVQRYLQRDRRLISTIERLACLAKLGRAAFAASDLDVIGNIMREAWLLHQELDPNCSNLFVDSLFQKVSHLSCGHKLVGAGGGGFAIIMAKHRDAAREMKLLLQSVGPPVQVYNWSLFE